MCLRHVLLRSVVPAAQARALNDEGMTAFTWIGSYHAPPATVTGSVRGDMCLVESAIGVGEVAIADHRGSQVSAAELARIAAEARVGGMLSGKVRPAVQHCKRTCCMPAG